MTLSIYLSPQCLKKFETKYLLFFNFVLSRKEGENKGHVTITSTVRLSQNTEPPLDHYRSPHELVYDHGRLSKFQLLYRKKCDCATVSNVFQNLSYKA